MFALAPAYLLAGKMRIAVTAPIYVANRAHLEYLHLTTKSIATAKHDIIWLPCENHVGPEFLPLAYQFDQPLRESRVLRPGGTGSVSRIGVKRHLR
jgi:hypothetical protein